MTQPETIDTLIRPMSFNFERKGEIHNESDTSSTRRY